MVGRNDRFDAALAAQGKAVWQVFLDRHFHSRGIGGEIDNRKTAERKLPVDAVVIELETGRKGVVGLLRH